MSKAKGSRAERELLGMFWENNFAGYRAAGSGSTPLPSPDLLVGNGKRYLAIECKSLKSKAKYLEEEQISIPVQVNGKVRDILVIEKDILNNKEVVEKMALGSIKVQKFLAGKLVKKVVYVTGKVINLVI